MSESTCCAVREIRRAVLFAVVVWVGLGSQSCLMGSRALNRKSLEVFAGFSFVGSGPYQQGAPPTGGISEALPKHGIAEQPLPDRPQVGIQYIFHHRLPVDNERLALVDLPGKLHAAGITITKSPKSEKDLMYLFIGGPAFKISVKDGRHEGMIYNQLDPDLMKHSSPEWAIEDYVLLWLK